MSSILYIVIKYPLLCLYVGNDHTFSDPLCNKSAIIQWLCASLMLLAEPTHQLDVFLVSDCSDIHTKLLYFIHFGSIQLKDLYFFQMVHLLLVFSG